MDKVRKAKYISAAEKNAFFAALWQKVSTSCSGYSLSRDLTGSDANLRSTV